jgi:hypothetical protein
MKCIILWNSLVKNNVLLVRMSDKGRNQNMQNWRREKSKLAVDQKNEGKTERDGKNPNLMNQRKTIQTFFTENLSSEKVKC